MINIAELLNLPNIHVSKISEIPSQELNIYIDTTESETKCRKCKRFISQRHGKDKERKIQHLPAFGSTVNIIYQPNR